MCVGLFILNGWGKDRGGVFWIEDGGYWMFWVVVVMIW